MWYIHGNKDNMQDRAKDSENVTQFQFTVPIHTVLNI